MLMKKKIGIYRNLRINAIAGPEVSQEFSKVRQSIVDELRNWYGELLPPAEPLHSSGKAVVSGLPGCSSYA